MTIKQLASTPCGKAVVEANDLQSLLNTLDREGLAGGPEQPASTAAKALDGVYEYYVNALLSAPSTQGVNAVSNMVPVSTRVFETMFAAGFSKARSKFWNSEAERTTFMEAFAEAQGIGEGFKEAFEFLGIRFGKAGLHGSSEEALAKMNIPEALAKQAKIERKHRAIKGNGDSYILNKGLDWLGNFVNIPGGALARMDEVYKIINYRAEVAKRAMHEAVNEFSDSGNPASRVQIQERFKALKQAALDNVDSDIAAKGVADADRRTFTNRPTTAIEKAMAEKGHTLPGMRWLVPFRRTMVNLISYGAGMTPAPLLNPKSLTWAALKEGGSAADEALGRMAAGTMLLTGLFYTLGDSMDGDPPSNLQARDLWEKDGHTPDSIRIGDKRIKIDLLGPIGPSLKIYARIQTAMSNIDEENDPDGQYHLTRLASEALFYTADVIFDEHWLSTMSQFFTALSDSSKEGDARALQVYASKFGTGFIPNVVKKEVTKAIDPNIKDITNSFDAVLAKLPGLSTSVANKISVWGDPIRYDHFLDPSYEEASTGKDPVSVEMRKIGLEFPERRRTIMAGDTAIRMTPEEFMQYQIWIGKGVRGASPLRDTIAKRIKSKAYKRMSVLGKEQYLKDAMNVYAERAKQELLYSPQFSIGQRVKGTKQNYHNRLRSN